MSHDPGCKTGDLQICCATTSKDISLTKLVCNEPLERLRSTKLSSHTADERDPETLQALVAVLLHVCNTLKNSPRPSDNFIPCRGQHRRSCGHHLRDCQEFFRTRGVKNGLNTHTLCYISETKMTCRHTKQMQEAPDETAPGARAETVPLTEPRPQEHQHFKASQKFTIQKNCTNVLTIQCLHDMLAPLLSLENFGRAEQPTTEKVLP